MPTLSDEKVIRNDIEITARDALFFDAIANLGLVLIDLNNSIQNSTNELKNLINELKFLKGVIK